MDDRRYRAGVGAVAAAVAAFLLLRLAAWPPHEDETLALYVGRGSLGELLDTVIGERGGAPLHFLFAWIVAHTGGGLIGLRLVSAAFAVASVPAIAALVSRLAGRRVAVLAATLAAASWVLLFHGIYARMYSIFLFTSLLSYLALLRALERGGRRRWLGWIAVTLACVATHPYGALVVASQALFVLFVRERVRESALAFGVLGVLGTPFWIADLVLAGRFDVGLGGGGDKLGAPLPVLRYLAHVAGDFSLGWTLALPFTLALAAAGAWRLARENRRAALLVGAVFAAPALAFLVARLGRNTAPETRHLIFALPFYATLHATALTWLAARRVALAAAATAALVVGAVAWGWTKTPALFEGEPVAYADAREAAAEWLAATARPDDILLGYEPVYLGAWERSAEASRLVLPRADAKLAGRELEDAAEPLGRGVWVFDAYDTNNVVQRLEIERRLPRPADAFEARAFGPYLIVRTLRPVRTPESYLRHAAAALIAGRTLDIGDADVNFATIDRVASCSVTAASRRPRSPRAGGNRARPRRPRDLPVSDADGASAGAAGRPRRPPTRRGCRRAGTSAHGRACAPGRSP